MLTHPGIASVLTPTQAMPRFSLGYGEVHELTQSQLDTAPRSVLAEAAACASSAGEMIDLSSWAKCNGPVFKVGLTASSGSLGSEGSRAGCVLAGCAAVLQARW